MHQVLQHSAARVQHANRGAYALELRGAAIAANGHARRGASASGLFGGGVRCLKAWASRMLHGCGACASGLRGATIATNVHAPCVVALALRDCGLTKLSVWCCRSAGKVDANAQHDIWVPIVRVLVPQRGKQDRALQHAFAPPPAHATTP
jgi:hypothetical protein